MNKSALRQEFLNKRKLLTKEEKENFDTHITANVEKFLINKPFRNIHTFLPQLDSGEIDTWKIISVIRKSFPSIQIAVPYIIPGTREMEHFLLDEQTELITNQWKIPEPDPIVSKKINPESIDAVLVPLLALDESGFRVGYGGGYYDRFFTKCRPDVVRIGLSFFKPVKEISDKNEFDIPLNFCITPFELYQFEPENA
ncbi:5-formyltetrahydrofolate cyclo-ligase [Dyadobacter sediminis]|uniref:5-formyltetrahydrofolate cyclo-ligase n=1 Tax=Dyadobacter sediminis TaxID=1493691 RepID=A0A5R9K886_9BACT|nr:5-formyltetrahydrofolate cyclo-ligase [Dyadobacter sediminis]TLU90054.1 5-formyltetrahydrofolate cyclo-ligase [Dyadobacter sediminis]GGC10579.1 5-formyltetrahydrofolate cyclo-ligase [Dyadobacter sediminis]